MEKSIAFPKKDLMTELFLAEQNLNHSQELFWNKIKTNPQVWKCNDVIEDNFWVVARHENHIVWYNDIIESFNISKFKIEGEILEYCGSKLELTDVLNALKYV